MRAQQSSRGRSAVLDLVAMRVLRETWRRDSRERPAVARLVLIAVGTFSVGVVLAGSGLALLGELIGGLALVPLSLAVFLRLLPPPPWTDADDCRGPGSRGDDHARPGTIDGPRAETDWDSFEHQFRAYVEKIDSLRSE